MCVYPSSRGPYASGQPVALYAPYQAQRTELAMLHVDLSECSVYEDMKGPANKDAAITAAGTRPS